ncbi:MAG: hypothetical protein JXM70_01490 [Pirellulales bacterium]|nr:hypothetical protein [Pirellulales bacterium]
MDTQRRLQFDDRDDQDQSPEPAKGTEGDTQSGQRIPYPSSLDLTGAPSRQNLDWTPRPRRRLGLI